MAGHSKETNSPQGCINYANKLIQLSGLNFPRISSIQDINSSFFIGLFEYATGQHIPDLLLGTDQTTAIHNVQAVIDTLSLDILGLSLSHISGEDIVSGNIDSIVNLLEIFEAVFLQLSNNGDKMKDSSDDSHPLSKPDFSENVKLSSDDSDKNIPASRPMKRKTCKKTLQKTVNWNHRPAPKKKMCEDVSTPSHSKWGSDTVDNEQPPLKRKKSKPVSTKQPHTGGIEELYDSNFEMKLRAILQSDLSPTILAQRMKKKYIQSLQTPLKRTGIPPCKKSFLLPYDLRRKAKSPDRKILFKRKPSSKRRSERLSISQSDKNKTDENVPEAIQSVLKEFPGFGFPKNIQELLIKRYYQHLFLMHKQLKSALLKKPTTLAQAEKAVEDEVKLSKILAKDLQEKKYLRELNEHKNVESRIKCGLRDARLQSAKMKQYYNEFQKSMSNKLQKRNISEELLVERTFKEVLNLQKEKVQLLCKKVKETNEQDAKQHSHYLNALKNLYEQQLDLLTESINAEQRSSAMRNKAQKQAIEKMNSELRKALQKEVRSLQKDVLEMIEDIHFRELDAQNFIENLQEQDS